MSDSGPEIRPLRLAEAIADGAEIDWRRLGTSGGEDPAQVRSFELIDTIFRDYGRAAEEVRARLVAPLLPPDSKWGPLRILDQVGAGSFGQVYRAFDPALQRDVALKVLRDPPRSPAGVPRFLDEARRLARVRHTGVLTVYGVAVHGGRAGIWTELVPGRTLEEILDIDGPSAPEEAARIGIAVCGALSAIHAAGLVHGDVKTQNVMCEEGGRVVLTDFGAMDERFEDARSEWSGRGSLLSIAPEILRGGPLSPASDVYALGVLLYRILSGRYPFVEQSPRDLLAAMDRGMPPLAEACPGVPPATAAAVERALAPDAERRFPGPNAMAQALQAALNPELPVKAAPVESYRPRRGRDSLLAALAACLVISAGVAWGVFSVGIPWLAQRFQGEVPVVAPVKTPAAGTAADASGSGATGADAAAPDAATPATTAAGTLPPPPDQGTIPAGLASAPRLYRVDDLGKDRLSDGGRIHAGDQLVLEVETGAQPVICYVLDEDGAGTDFVLFPLARGSGNPLAAGARHVLPGDATGEAPAARTWTVDSEHGRENVVVVTSTVALPWFERLIRDIPRASEDGGAPAGVVTRGIGRVAAAPVTGKLGRLLERVRASKEYQSGRAGIWRVALRAQPRVAS